MKKVSILYVFNLFYKFTLCLKKEHYSINFLSKKFKNKIFRVSCSNLYTGDSDEADEIALDPEILDDNSSSSQESTDISTEESTVPTLEEALEGLKKFQDWFETRWECEKSDLVFLQKLKDRALWII